MQYRGGNEWMMQAMQIYDIPATTRELGRAQRGAFTALPAGLVLPKVH